MCGRNVLRSALLGIPRIYRTAFYQKFQRLRMNFPCIYCNYEFECKRRNLSPAEITVDHHLVGFYKTLILMKSSLNLQVVILIQRTIILPKIPQLFRKSV